MKPRNNNEKKDGYEEPKAWWYIDIHLVVKRGEIYLSNYAEILKEIGNYFETREEAEKAVEKLKAWKRLKDKGFKFVRIVERNEGHRIGQYIEFEVPWHFNQDSRQIGYDLAFLFGGEE